jgi:hypothetical protein
VIEATKGTHYYSPILPDVDDKGSKGLMSALLPGLFACREFAGALSTRAMLRVGHGQPDAAWHDLLACHRLARMVSRGPTLIEVLVGVAIELIACRADVAFLAHTQPEAKQLEGYLSDLRALPPLPDVAEKWNLCERYWLLDSLMLCDQRGVSQVPFYDGNFQPLRHGLRDEDLNGVDWDPALELANKGYDRLAAALREKDRATRMRKLGEIDAELRPHHARFVSGGGAAALKAAGSASDRGRVFGDMLFSTAAIHLRNVADAADRVAQTHDNVLAAFALAAYHRDNGKYPGKLDALAPKYLPKAPADLFSGGALVYTPTADGYLLYSVGINEKDDGGRTAEEQAGCDDLVVRMPPR